MSSEAELNRSILDLKAEINGLEKAILGARYEDFKKVVLAQISYVITDYYQQYLSSNFERIDCISTCPYRKDCRNELSNIFQGISASFLRDDFDTPLQELDRAESLITGLHSPCQSKACHDLQLTMVNDVRALVMFIQRMYERFGAQPSKGASIENDAMDSERASKMLTPLSHPARLRVLRALSLRDHTFTDLSKDLELRTGHLQFHLRPLLDEGYVSKQRNRGDYSITPRGRAALDLVEMFCQRLDL